MEVIPFFPHLLCSVSTICIVFMSIPSLCMNTTVGEGFMSILSLCMNTTVREGFMSIPSLCINTTVGEGFAQWDFGAFPLCRNGGRRSDLYAGHGLWQTMDHSSVQQVEEVSILITSALDVCVLHCFFLLSGPWLQLEYTLLAPALIVRHYLFIKQLLLLLHHTLLILTVLHLSCN